MKIRKALIIILTVFTTTTFAQETFGSFELKTGIGASLIGSGDMHTLMLENELSYRINSYVSSSISIGMGRSDQGIFDAVSFVQGNANIYLSPFKNTLRNDFKIGSGLSILSISDYYVEYSGNNTNGTYIELPRSSERKPLGLNLILENSYYLTPRFSVGLKAFTQLYKNGDTNTGLMFRLGARL